MFEHIRPEEIPDNPFQLIGNDWMIISCDDGTRKNGMTASWGGMGVLWGRPVCFCFIRPQRHTFSLAENTNKFTFCFFDESHRQTLNYFGRVSGRDEDKIKTAGITPVCEDGYLWYEQARLVVKGRKLYEDEIREGNFVDLSCLDTYRKKDYHTMYVCQVEDVLIRRDGEKA